MSVGQQFKGVQGGKALDDNPISAANKNTSMQSSAPNDEQLKIDYGSIAEVDYETSHVRINRLTRGQVQKRIGESKENKDGIWIPILQPLPVIHASFGSLRPGLTVRIFWRGKNDPGSDAIAEVISEKPLLEFITGSEKPRSNELYTGPGKYSLGGVIK